MPSAAPPVRRSAALRLFSAARRRRRRRSGAPRSSRRRRRRGSAARGRAARCRASTRRVALERRERREVAHLRRDRAEPCLVEPKPVERAGVEAAGRGADVGYVRLQHRRRALVEQRRERLEGGADGCVVRERRQRVRRCARLALERLAQRAADGRHASTTAPLPITTIPFSETTNRSRSRSRSTPICAPARDADVLVDDRVAHDRARGRRRRRA